MNTTTTLDRCDEFCRIHDLELDIRERAFGCSVYAIGNNEYIRRHPQSRKQKGLPYLSYEVHLGGFPETPDQAWDFLYPPRKIPDAPEGFLDDTW